ncbi:MAG: hypothetical protein HC859_16940, partial [Bacteroidia bacterium]|nr:hypothetical protein [Bacteroidia bacterium]
MQDFTTLEAFPFKTVLNLKPLVEFWTKRALMGEMPIFSNHLLARLEAAPELSQPIYDHSVLERHHDLLMFLASAVIPPAGCETDLTAMISPFEFTEVFATKAFKNAMPLDKIDKMVSVNAPGNSMVLGKTL